jgi:exopolysaccharide biosynthesis polyprenyl glycosylphosphotransferase
MFESDARMPAPHRSSGSPRLKTANSGTCVNQSPLQLLPGGSGDNGVVPPIHPAAPHRTLDPGTLKRRLVYADLIAFGLGVLLALAIQDLLWPVARTTFWAQVLLTVTSVPIWIALAASANLYVARVITRFRDELRGLVVTALLWVASISAIAFAAQFDELSRRWVVAVFVSVLVVQIAERMVARSVFQQLRRAGRTSRPILIVGTDAYSVELAQRLRSRPELGYLAIGFIGAADPRRSDLGLPVLGDVQSTALVAMQHGATGVMISLSSVDGSTVNLLTRRLTDAGLHVTLCSSLSDIDIRRLRFQDIDRNAMIYIEPTVRTGWRWVAKRVFDFVVSIVGLILTAPIIVIASIAVRIESPGPVVFRQVRIGRNGHEFEMLKLRTMVDGADRLKTDLLHRNESDGPLFKIKDDPRVTRVGRLLRKFSIDELPQFWNVVRGEMSVVGPRPALASEVAQWDDDVHERLRVLPGVTGIWQVSGRAGTSFEQYKRLDQYYVDNWSLVKDLRIVFKTVVVVLAGRGAS